MEADPDTSQDILPLHGRHLVFLQGPNSLFFKRLALVCRSLGARCTRICLAPGDRVFWSQRAGQVVWFKGSPEEFAGAVSGILADLGATDLVILGDVRPCHRAALARANDGVRNVILEHGYLRPGLILIERVGMGARSDLPLHFASWQPTGNVPEASPARGSFVSYAIQDVIWNLANLTAPLFGMHFRPHGHYHPLLEYGLWTLRALRHPFARAAGKRRLARLISSDQKLFLLALQLPGDLLLDRDDPAGDLPRLHQVITSFLSHAPKDAALIVKPHPLDPAPWRWRKAINVVAEDGERIVLVEGFDLAETLPRLTGLVTRTSTSALAAIAARVPTLCLAPCVWNRAGLTAQAGIDAFWANPTPPDATLARDFLTFLRVSAHVPGSFEGKGASIGAREVADFIARKTAP